MLKRYSRKVPFAERPQLGTNPMDKITKLSLISARVFSEKNIKKNQTNPRGPRQSEITCVINGCIIEVSENFIKNI